MYTTNTTRPLFALLTTLTFAACGGDGGGSTPTDTVVADTSATTDTTTSTSTSTSESDATVDTDATGCGIAAPAGAACNPYPGCESGCTGGDTCTNVKDGANESVMCHATDGVALGGTCDHATGPFCADGACIGRECREFCDVDEDCANETTCRPYISSGVNVRVCGASSSVICDQFQPKVSCGDGTSCYRDVVAARSSCVPDGDQPFGADCTCANCCESGLTCTRNSVEETGICGENCVLGGPGERGCASRCEGLVPWRPLNDANTVAFCVPFESYDIVPATLGAAVSGELTEIGEYDVFSFAGEAGDVVRVDLTTPGSGFDTDGIDAIVSVHRVEGGAVVAIADDSLFADAFDSDVVTILPATGSYYVLVRDCWTYQGERPDKDFGCYLPIAKSQRSYTVRVSDITETTVADGEGGDTAAEASPLTFPASGGSYGGTIARGTYRDANDVDVFAFTVPAGLSVSGQPGKTYRAEVLIRGFAGGVTGPHGSGSASAFGAMWLTTAAAPDTIIARLVDADTDDVITIPVERGEDYLLWVAPPGDAAPTGADDYYFVAVAPGRSLQLEGAGDNDSAANAEALTDVFSSATQDVYQFAGDLGDGDQDFFSFPIEAPKRQINVVCWAASLGSGLEGMQATLYTADGTPMQNGVATDSQEEPALLLERFAAAQATSFVLGISAPSTSSEVTARHYECQVILAEPPPEE